jgi:hypothetical protein
VLVLGRYLQNKAMKVKISQCIILLVRPVEKQGPSGSKAEELSSQMSEAFYHLFQLFAYRRELHPDSPWDLPDDSGSNHDW